MSLDASRWAWQQQGLRPIQKLVLLSLADRAGDAQSEYWSWPSYQAIVNDTGADIKSVKSAIRDLAAAGLIEDTGKRAGATQRVIVWRLAGIDRREGNEPKNGMIPKTEGKQARFSHETSPKTDGKRAQKRASEPTKEPTKEPITPLTPHGGPVWVAEEEDLPVGVRREVWAAFCRHRREIRKPLKPTGCRAILGHLATWQAQGHDPNAVLETSITNGWQGVFEPKPALKPPGGPVQRSHLTAVDMDPNALRAPIYVSKLRPA
jgi:hypothetical protein